VDPVTAVEEGCCCDDEDEGREDDDGAEEDAAALSLQGRECVGWCSCVYRIRWCGVRGGHIQ
jgi:hypothetical protein